MGNRLTGRTIQCVRDKIISETNSNGFSTGSSAASATYASHSSAQPLNSVLLRWHGVNALTRSPISPLRKRYTVTNQCLLLKGCMKMVKRIMVCLILIHSLWLRMTLSPPSIKTIHYFLTINLSIVYLSSSTTH